MYLGNDEILEMYLGDDSMSEAYLGEDLVFSTGPFEGLKVTPKSLSFNSYKLSASIKIKASESWSMTIPAWITASTLTGDTGDTIVSLTAATQTATTTGSIVVTSANYSASASCFFLIGVPQLQIDGVADISTSFSPYAAYTGNSNYLKCEISAEWTGSRNSGAYLYACGGSAPFFSCERFRTSDIPYCNIGNGDVSNGPENGGGLDHTWVFEVNGNNVATFIDGDPTQTKTISGSWPTGNLSFAKYQANNLHINFYWVKFWGANNTLLAEFVPDSSGGILEKVSNTVYPKVGTGTTSYSLVIPPTP